MNLIRWELDRAPELAACYNRHTAAWPYCHPQTPDGFAAGIAEELGYLYGKKRDCLHAEHFLVAQAEDEVAGFLHLGLEEKEGEKTGIIRFMAYEPGRRQQGQALLEAAERQCRDWGAVGVSAFAKANIYHFCSVDGGYDTAQAHIGALFGINGYEPGGPTLHMAKRGLETEEPVPPDEKARIEVAGDAQRGERNDVMVMAYAPGTDDCFAELYAYSLQHVQSVAAGADQLYINWLGIDRQYQGQGWGRYLLRRALYQAHLLGYRHCVLGTDAGNYRAQLLYASHGFGVTHFTRSYFKRLDL